MHTLMDFHATHFGNGYPHLFQPEIVQFQYLKSDMLQIMVSISKKNLDD